MRGCENFVQEKSHLCSFVETFLALCFAEDLLLGAQAARGIALLLVL